MAGVEGVRFFPDDGDIVGETEAPPGTAVEGAYAVRVFGRSMKPVYDPGDLVCVNPHQTAEPGDKVVVQISTDGGVTIEVFIKRLVSLDDKRLIVEQFNPPDQMRWPREHVVAVHRIIWGGPGPGG